VSFYYKNKDFATILIFLGFCHNSRKRAKEEKKKEKKNAL
jgi:hypothetical protein